MGGARRWDGVWAAAVALAAYGWLGGDARVGAQPINPKVFKQQFEDACKDAEVVAVVRVLSASCTETAGQGKPRSVTLELALQVVRSEKGPVKQGDILVVSHKVTLPAGPGPKMYGSWAPCAASRSRRECAAMLPCAGTPSSAATPRSRAGSRCRT
jgi:hypothetical protein